MIVIIDYQMGNLRSVQKALEKVGTEAEVSSDPRVVAQAEKLILPGVGAFRDAIAELQRRDLVEPIHEFIESGRPFLGICLGLQLLFDVSYEGGEYQGLGILPGEVIRFDVPAEYKVPHMGWNQVRANRSLPLMEGIPEDSYFYFVHSYYVKPQDESCVALTTNYHLDFCAAVCRDNLFATQFHPEKSQEHGLQLLRNFSNLQPASLS